MYQLFSDNDINYPQNIEKKGKIQCLGDITPWTISKEFRCNNEQIIIFFKTPHFYWFNSHFNKQTNVKNH